MPHRTVGGVSGIRPTPRVAASGQPAYPDFVYNGGPVISTPAIYPIFLGANWSDPAHQLQASRLVQYLKDLIGSDWMNILTQYGVAGPGNGQVVNPQFIPNVAASVSDVEIHSILQNAIDAGTLPEPPANNTSAVVAIFLDETVGVSDSAIGVVMCEANNDNAFGYHYYFTSAAGNVCYYSVIPALDDTCINETCPGGSSGCSLSLALTQEQRRTQVMSHELAEMLTDPQVPSGWYGQTADEVGDICNGQTAVITAGDNTWNVQRIYSKTDDVKSNGASYCLASSPTPIPKLS